MKEAYEDLPILPSIVAERVIRQEYTGNELSSKLRANAKEIAKIEELRKEVTPDEEALFCELCDARCKQCYELNSPWFMKIVEMNDGRDQLEMFLSHWLVAFLLNGKKSIARLA